MKRNEYFQQKSIDVHISTYIPLLGLQILSRLQSKLLFNSMNSTIRNAVVTATSISAIAAMSYYLYKRLTKPKRKELYGRPVNNNLVDNTIDLYS